jgi:alpha-N-acetylglucosaminidase
MGNIEGYRAPLPSAWIDKKQDLQRKILARMRELDMSPILPAFAGYVPKAFALKNPTARIYRMRSGRVSTRPTGWIPPIPFFPDWRLGFLRSTRRPMARGPIISPTPYNEMTPPIAEDGADAASAFDDATGKTVAAKVEVDPALKARRLPPMARRSMTRSAQADLMPSG